MKKPGICLLLSALVLAGCANGGKNPLDAVGDKLEEGLDRVLTTAEVAIGRQEAVAIAFHHAGVAEDRVTDLRTEYEPDEGQGHYEIQFVADGWEYEYEIAANSGKILSFEKENK